eukprot:2633151-Ditylum_brightwellii.AAC.1
MEKFVLVMDNYFALPKVMHALGHMGISVIGTSCFRKGWPPRDLCAVTQQESNFNDFCWCINECSTLLGRWLDNVMIFFVSKVCIQLVEWWKEQEEGQNSKS